MTTTVREQATRSRVAAPLPVVRLLYSGERGVVVAPPHVLRAGPTRIGRDAGGPGALALPRDQRLSRDHALIRLELDGSLRIEDRGSSNGTFVNGARVGEAALAPGDLVRVGDSFLLVALEPAEPEDGDVPSLVGTSPAIRSLRAAIARLAPTAATVLLLGETGAGKEVAAQALHALSPRARQPLEILDCGAVSRGLVESELFGHEKGAFTGAAQQRKGLFERADGGTLFIDELGEMPLDLQPKLLRALEQREVRRVGGARPIAVDARIIAATNRDLAEEVRAGRFRADLHARLAEVVVRLPPLRERREDVLELLLHARRGEPIALHPSLVEALLLHRWPYNVREVFKLAVQLRTFPSFEKQEELAAQLRAEPPQQAPRETPTLTTSTVAGAPSSAQASAPASAPAIVPRGPRVVGPPTPEQLREALRQHRGNVSALARSIGVSRRQLHRWMKQLELDGDSFRGSSE